VAGDRRHQGRSDVRPVIRMDTSGFQRKLAALGPEKRKALEKATFATAINVHRKAVVSIQRGPATGRVYEKYNPQRTHQASAPGQPPQSDQAARLAGSIAYVGRGLTYEVGTSVKYGLYLELGTSEIEPRPWLVPAVESERPAWRARILEALK